MSTICVSDKQIVEIYQVLIVDYRYTFVYTMNARQIVIVNTYGIVLVNVLGQIVIES